MEEHLSDVAKGARFQFGKNWQSFLSVLDEERIVEAENSLKEYLGIYNLKGLTFLDIGSGSGLFSLAARRLDADVHSFDYDPLSVECTKELKRRYFKDDDKWFIQQGSVLDIEFMDSLGGFDIVYSWGVLHHTGDMNKALENAVKAVNDNGYLFISIYNYQVYWTAINTKIKRTYNKAPRFGKTVIVGMFVLFQFLKGLIKDILFLRNPYKRYADKKKSRGMSMWHDWIDWIGGYPFEVAKPEQIFDFYFERGFILQKIVTVGGGHGCNEYVFRKITGG